MSDRPGEMDERDVDERFASIVAGWGSPTPTDAPEDDAPDGPGTGRPGAGDGEPAGEADRVEADPDDGPGHDEEARSGEVDGIEAPDADDVGDDAEDSEGSEGPGGPRETSGRAALPPWVNPSPLDAVVPASSWRVSPPTAGTTPTPPPAEPDDEHYEPPPVTLPPQEDLHFWGAVVGLVGGPLLLLYVALARPFHSDRWFAAGVVLSLVGFGLLVLRQPRHRDPTDGDDGARV